MNTLDICNNTKYNWKPLYAIDAFDGLPKQFRLDSTIPPLPPEAVERYSKMCKQKRDIHTNLTYIREIELKHLRDSLHDALLIKENDLAARILEIGFRCLKCAECCRSACGDNTVTIFPSEIRKISQNKGLPQQDFVIPMPSQDRDKEGNIHTFEWVLKRNNDCIFLKNNKCEIYPYRPHICITYPFYLLDGELQVSECRGIGQTIILRDSLRLAELLKERYITEIRESISIFERFKGFVPGTCRGICIHDSEGEHWLTA